MPNRTSNTLTKIQSFMQKYISKSFNNHAAVAKCSWGRVGARIFATPMPGACSFFFCFGGGGAFLFKKDYTKLHITELSLSMLVDHSS